MSNQTIPSSNGDYVEDVNHDSLVDIGNAKLPEEF